ncbi:methylase of polypeptide subunit release factors [Microbacterium terrae]|uniref:Ribosomal RNA small subunit methyltransferase C n=1 Tax=Microbacterium terrae TaxID=69369 RepID=A0A0M2H3Z3_9MICO|nr:methyltransferase [Microbacterium terrae]KJL38416.1 Ribosomal RNA small subunit methyltransferase C [Microbacterium terrae]MBP1078942.1 methylase of polypeptide subunit release factors [Microbacterium terrae]GLJ98342.1 methyltransferase [Microbacterium terrae]
MLPQDDPALCAALAADLDRAGFTAEALRSAWGDAADDAIARGLRRPADRALGDRGDPLAVLGRLLVLGMPQAAASVDSALPAAGADGLVALGLATRDGDATVPTALIRPQSVEDAAAGAARWWIASDLDEAALGGALPVDHVLGVGGASLTLASLQLPTPAASALDIGAGCGIQALRARRSADRVVATDISERALAFTRLNARLNGVDAIETRHGSLFAPVAGERFERIVSNPPFVITPRTADVPEYEYRDGGMVGDDLVAAFIGGVGEHLEPGGVAQLLGNWETRSGVAGIDRVREWVAASPVPLDAWVVEREVLDPLSYAELWVRDGGTLPGTPGFARLLDAWLDDFVDREVTEVGFGYILLRRPAAGEPTLDRFESLPQPVGSEPLGAHLAEALAAHDALALLDDEALAAAVLTVAPDVTEARHHLPGAEEPTVIEVRQGGGFGRALSVDPGLAALVGASDGDLPVGVLVDAIAQLLEVDAAALRADLLPRVREMVFTGFLRLAGHGR